MSKVETNDLIELKRIAKGLMQIDFHYVSSQRDIAMESGEALCNALNKICPGTVTDKDLKHWHDSELDSEATTEQDLKTAAQWYAEDKTCDIVDPDGWNRTDDYNNGFQTLPISHEEYIRRRDNSTTSAHMMQGHKPVFR